MLQSESMLRDLSLIGSYSEQQQQILKVYIKYCLNREVAHTRFSSKDTIFWLAWLAQQMQLREYTEFYLEHLSPSWLGSKWMRYICQLSCLFVGFVVGSISGLVCGEAFGSVIGFIIGIVIGLIVGSVFSSQEFQPAEALIVSWKSILVSTILGLFLNAMLGLIISFIIGVSIELLFIWAIGPIFVLIFVLFFGFSDFVPMAIPEGSLGSKSNRRPNQGMWKSRKNALQIGLFSTISCGIAFGPTFGLALGLTFGSILGLVYGGLACIRHYILRFLLRQQGALPWHYVHFLEEARERSLLERVGGGYHFFNSLFQKYFASLSPDDISEFI
jgi:hypothetical protein